MTLLTGKTALITGAARGIGKAIALRMAQEGANIVFTDLVLSDATEQLEAELQANGVKAKGYASNAAKFEETKNVVEEIARDFGRIDVLVNNAGITKDGAVKRMTEEQWDAVINVNLKSVFNFTKSVQPIMWRQAGGSIINMSSVVGVSGNANQANYAASKAGIIGFTKSVAKEFGIRNIRCNAIAPGFIETEMTAVLPDDVRKSWIEKIPLHRGGSPDDVANVALFLASDLSAYVSGQVINVCGAMNT
jgi:3-oxoacyl-[acyl-carrier protein] reductase